jgi:5-formyltetrahydrofolate cyclo-ligase
VQNHRTGMSHAPAHEAQALHAAPTMEAKQQLRAHMKSIRDGLGASAREEKSAEVCRLLMSQWAEPLRGGADAQDESEGARPPMTLAAFVPARSEVNVLAWMRWCWAQRIPVAVPRVELAARTMTLRYIAGEHELMPGPYGISQPAPHAPLAPQPGPDTRMLMLVPGLAFDAAGRRLGYGGGYYDRLLQTCRPAIDSGALTLIAPAFAAQIRDVVPTQPHDIAVHFVVTEAGVIDCSQFQSE